MFNGRGVPVITNSVFWANTDIGGMDESAQIDGIADDPIVNWSCVQGGWSGAGGMGNISTDPMFVDGPNGDLRLMAGSPCIDAADTTAVPTDDFDIDEDGLTSERLPLDLDGNPRFVDDPNTPDTGCGFPNVDMGSYEFQEGLALQVILGDLNFDETVSTADLLILLGAWGAASGECVLEDIDQDGAVGTSDLLILLGNWG